MLLAILVYILNIDNKVIRISVIVSPKSGITVVNPCFNFLSSGNTTAWLVIAEFCHHFVIGPLSLTYTQLA